MRKWKLGIRTRKGRGRVDEKEILRKWREKIKLS
jgi:hypothetical protein